MIPFCPSCGGGSHDNVAVREVTLVTVRLAGGAVGAAGRSVGKAFYLSFNLREIYQLTECDFTGYHFS